MYFTCPCHIKLRIAKEQFRENKNPIFERMMKAFYLLILLFYFPNFSGQTEFILQGQVVDAKGQGLAFVNIGIRSGNKGTVTNANGNFTLSCNNSFNDKLLSFSSLAYRDTSILIALLKNRKFNLIVMQEQTQLLPEVQILPEKLHLKKIGIVKYNPIFHWIDASQDENDSYEVAQLLVLPESSSQIVAVHFYVNETNVDSSLFRLNFYEYKNNLPGNKLNKTDLLTMCPLSAGWNTIDLSMNHIWLKGKIVMALEILPLKGSKIKFDVKLGGKTKSFVRPNSLAEWQEPPHHYRMYADVMAPLEKIKKLEDLEIETPFTYRLYSPSVQDSFFIYVRLPKKYLQNNRNYKVRYLLDANVYFDQVEELQDEILIGIGYENAFVADKLRDRDDTYPRKNQVDLAGTGGAPNFLNFISAELMPLIKTKYRTDTINNCLMGHSLAAYFCLYALANKPLLFNEIIAASPSLDYAPFYLKESFLKVSKGDAFNTKLILTIGSREDQKLFEKFKPLFESVYPSLKLKVLPASDHMSTALPSFRMRH